MCTRCDPLKPPAGPGRAGPGRHAHTDASGAPTAEQRETMATTIGEHCAQVAPANDACARAGHAFAFAQLRLQLRERRKCLGSRTAARGTRKGKWLARARATAASRAPRLQPDAYGRRQKCRRQARESTPSHTLTPRRSTQDANMLAQNARTPRALPSPLLSSSLLSSPLLAILLYSRLAVAIAVTLPTFLCTFAYVELLARWSIGLLEGGGRTSRGGQPLLSVYSTCIPTVDWYSVY